MSDKPRKYHLNSDAATEHNLQGKRAAPILEQLAADLAAGDPTRPDAERDLVERSHVLRAAELLYGSIVRDLEESLEVMSPPIFISYSSEDRDFVQEINADLAKAGLAAFLAERSIETSADWAKLLWRAMRRCRVAFFVLTPQAVQ